MQKSHMNKRQFNVISRTNNHSVVTGPRPCVVKGSCHSVVKGTSNSVRHKSQCSQRHVIVSSKVKVTV